MRLYLLIVLFGLGHIRLMAQLIPVSSQPFQLMQSYNPAFVGVENFTSVKVGYRNQWVSFPGSPQYLNLNFSTRIKQPTDIEHNALKSRRPYPVESLPIGKRIIQGIGVNLAREKYGVIENVDIGLSYSYQIPLAKKVYLSLGVSPSYSNSRIQMDRLQTKDSDQFLEYLQSGSGSNAIFNVRSGVMVYSPGFYLQFSYLKTWSKTLDENVSPIGYSYVASGGLGVTTSIGPTAKLKPSIFLLVDEENNVLVDYSVKAYFNTQIWGGVAYRSVGFGSVILGFELNSVVGASYSYEISTGGLKGFQKGSHEIVLGFKLGNLRKLNPYIW